MVDDATTTEDTAQRDPPRQGPSFFGASPMPVRAYLDSVRDCPDPAAHQLPADVLESELRRMYHQGVTDAPQFQSAEAREVLCKATVHGALRILRAALAAAGERPDA